MVETMDIARLKEKLIEERAVHTTEMAAARLALTKFKEALGKITGEDLQVIQEMGYSAEFIKDIQLERLEKDNDYLKEVQAQMQELLSALYDRLEREINA